MNTTQHADAAEILRQIEDTCHAAGVDLDGVERAKEISERIARTLPSLLDERLSGHGSEDPAIRRWLDERGADIDAVFLERALASDPTLSELVDGHDVYTLVSDMHAAGRSVYDIRLELVLRAERAG